MLKKPFEILVVDDEVNQRKLLRSICEPMGVKIEEASDGDLAVDLCRKRLYDLVFMDMKMERMDGLEALRQIRQIAPRQQVIILTAFGSVETAVEAMKYGAMDYFTKPYDVDEIRGFIEKVAGEETGPSASEEDRDKWKRMMKIEIIGRSRVMQKLYEDMEMIAPTDATVLIQGESGTGKGLVARGLYVLSDRNEEPYLRVNCGALTESLLEQELFGVEAHTSAGREGKRGMLEMAHRGTIFLDEVGDMSAKLQVRLLNVIQDRYFVRVGGVDAQNVDVRVIAATNKDLFRLVQEGRFREDLYYRLNVVSLVMPPLRERPEDIPLLIDYFLKRSMEKNHKLLKGFHKDAMHMMLSYGWPGNVRELENAIERSVILSRQERILPENLPLSIQRGGDATSDAKGSDLPSFSIKKLERDAIVKALRMTQNNRTEAAKLLGISRRTLQYKLKEYSIADDETTG